MHHQLIERRLVADRLHPFLGVIELARSLTQPAVASFRRHHTDLWPGEDYAPAVALMVEQLPGAAAWARGGRRSGGDSGECAPGP